jgi:hypothetical protein
MSMNRVLSIVLRISFLVFRAATAQPKTMIPALRSASLFFILLSGVRNVASGIPSLRGNVGIRDLVLRENPVDRRRRLDDDSELRIEQERKLYAACSKARAKANSHAGRGIDAVDGVDELILAAQMACNTWFAWTDDR